MSRQVHRVGDRHRGVRVVIVDHVAHAGRVRGIAGVVGLEPPCRRTDSRLRLRTEPADRSASLTPIAKTTRLAARRRIVQTVSRPAQDHHPSSGDRRAPRCVPTRPWHLFSAKNAHGTSCATVQWNPNGEGGPTLTTRDYWQLLGRSSTRSRIRGWTSCNTRSGARRSCSCTRLDVQAGGGGGVLASGFGAAQAALLVHT